MFDEERYLELSREILWIHLICPSPWVLSFWRIRKPLVWGSRRHNSEISCSKNDDDDDVAVGINLICLAFVVRYGLNMGLKKKCNLGLYILFVCVKFCSAQLSKCKICIFVRMRKVALLKSFGRFYFVKPFISLKAQHTQHCIYAFPIFSFCLP